MLHRSAVVIFARIFIDIVIRFNWYGPIDVVLTSKTAWTRDSYVQINNRTIDRVILRVLDSPILAESGLVNISYISYS